MSISPNARIERYGLVFLMWLGFLLQGEKNPVTFFFWGAGALALLALRLRPILSALSLRAYRTEGAVAVCLFFAQIFSKDPSQSLYYTAQAYLFLCLWVGLKADPALLPDTPLLFTHLLAMGWIALIVTGWQWMHAGWSYTYGIFPNNHIFNAAWIGSIGAGLTAGLISEKRLAGKMGSPTFVTVSAALLVAAPFLLPARSVPMGIVAGVLYAGYQKLTFRPVLLMMIVFTGILALLPASVIQHRLRVQEANPRLQIWSAALQSAKANPLTGTGLGNFELAYQRYAPPVQNEPVQYGRTTVFAHNEFLQVLSDVGILAFLILLFGWIQFFRFSTPGGSSRARWGKTICIVMTVVAFYNFIWHLPIFIFLTILACRLAWTEQARKPEERPVHPFIRIGLVGILGVIGCILAGCAVRQLWANQGRWDALVRWNPGDAEAWKSWGDSRRTLDATLNGYARAVELVPENPYFREAFALALEATHRPENYPRAIEQYRAAHRYAPGRAHNALAIGRVLFILKKPDEALEWFQTAQRIEPHYWESDLWIARALTRLGKTRQAAAVLKNLRKRHQTYVEWNQRAGIDFPSHTPSAYEGIILSYDERVVNRELRAL